MNPEETCPGCGSPIRTVEGKGTDWETVVYVCGTGEDAGYFGRECWANQCMQAQERIKELEGLLGDHLEVVKEIIKNMGKSRQYSELWYDLHDKAAALVNRLEAGTGGK